MGSRGRLILRLGRGASDLYRLAAGWRRGDHKLYRVRGSSMEPTLHDGDYVVVDKSRQGQVALGDIVVARSPESGGILVKRLRSMGQNSYALGSDSPVDARDSRHFGSIDDSMLIGPVVLCIPASRLRTLSR